MKEIINKTVTSSYQASSNNESAENGRLNETNPSQSWHPDDLDSDPHLEIDFNDTITVTALRVRGSVNNVTGQEEFVSTFVIEYLNNNTEEWVVLTNDIGDEKIFEANEDGVTVKTAELDVPIWTKVCLLFSFWHKQTAFTWYHHHP